MQYLLNSDMTRNYDYAMYNNMDEFVWNTKLFDPNGYNLNTGLYDRTQPSAQYWIDHGWQYMTDNHLALANQDYVEKSGKMHYSSSNAPYGLPSSYKDLRYVVRPPPKYY